MGCMGMGLDDFCRCTPSEFRAAWTAHAEREERLERDGWERVRMLAICSLQPYSQKRLEPADVMPLPWDKGKDGKTAPGARNAADAAMTREELVARYEEAKRRRGLK